MKRGELRQIGGSLQRQVRRGGWVDGEIGRQGGSVRRGGWVGGEDRSTDLEVHRTGRTGSDSVRMVVGGGA